MSLQDLPTEILLMCLQKLDRPDYRYRRFYAWANIRLTCRRFARLVIPLLFSKITVQFSSTCLQRLERLSQNPSIAGSITHVTIALPCYDPAMLEDFSLFVRSRAYALELSMIVIWHDSTTGKIFEEIEEERSRILSTWDAVGDGDYDIDHIDQNLKLLQQSHQNYKKLYCDQQERKPVMLLSEILKRLNNLQQISIDDSVQEEGHVDEKGHLVLAWESGYIPASMWSGSEFGPNIATPWKLIADIFDTMEMLSVHPAKFCLDIYEAIFDPRAFQMSPECLVRIGDILKDTKSIRVHIEQAYKDRDDIEDDIESVGLLTNALCNVASLQELELSFLCIDGYRPAAFVLPLGKTTWVHLRTLKLRRIAFTREKFRMLLQQCNKDVLEDVHLYDVESPSMSRQDVSEDLKSFTKVRKIIWRDA